VTPSLLHPRECSDRTLPKLLASSDGPVVVASHFGGWEWKALGDEAWTELETALGKRVRGVEIETGENREFATRHGLEIVPAVLVFLGGVVVARLSGRVRASQVIEAVRRAEAESRSFAAAVEELELAVERAERPSPLR